MILWIVAFLGGLLTILSPCILPVLPFVFSRAEEPFRRSGLPLLAGMAVMFAAVSTLAVVGGSWVVHANEYGRWAALILFSLFALSLLFPQVAEWVTRPFTRLGGTLQAGPSEKRGILRSFVLGGATGLLWAPCAGPILGLILTSAAVKGASANTSVLLLAYALGAAASLSLVLLAGNQLIKKLRGFLGVEEWIRKILGAAVLLGVFAIALGWDRGILTRLSRFHTDSLEQKLVSKLGSAMDPGLRPAGMTDERKRFPELTGAVAWLNSPPLSPAALRGKVVLIDFWTYSCINCLRTLPYVEAWSKKYKDSGLVVIGVHTPEFAFEKDPANVAQALRELGVTYPVAIDSHYAIWNAFGNQYWPAHYLIDASGKIQFQHFGEGGYKESEKQIQQLLSESGVSKVPAGMVDSHGAGSLAPSLTQEDRSPETYIGYDRAENQISHPPVAEDEAATYSTGNNLALNQWSLGGRWKVGEENAQLIRPPGKIVFRFHARDLHLVLGAGPSGKAVHFIVRLDGKAPGPNHGADTDESGRGEVREQRLYQLIRQVGSAPIQDRTFEIEFLDPGVQAFAFTFG